ncbi:MAG: hypothetical protein KAI79_01180 [Bacteroidales bacterium]|nr:hypothetical protein [Bacteroidales bacterium]
MKITTFCSGPTHTKVPHSPFDDDTFEFITQEVNFTPSDIAPILASNFVLNRNYTFNKLTKVTRTKTQLKKHLEPEFEHILLDIDKVYTAYSKNKILTYFKEKGYSVILFESRSHNGVDNYNMKGFIKARGLNNRESILAVLTPIKADLHDYGKIDLSAIGEPSYQAPSFSQELLLHNEGKYLPNKRIIQKPKPKIKDLSLDTEILNICVSQYNSMGYYPTSEKEDGLIVFMHPSEKTPNGYFMYRNNPLNMFHFNPDKSFSIFNEVKTLTPVKKYFEGIESEKRKKEFAGKQPGKNSVIVNKRYLSFTPEISDMVDQWYIKSGLLKIKSAMGTGKSNIIEGVINKALNDTKPILLITNRISVARDFKKKYDIKLYSDGNYEIGDSLIVQYDSLWKYSLKHFDVVILDEFMSIVLHSRSGLGDYSNLNMVKLQYALKNKKTVIADAFLYGYEDVFNTTRPRFNIINKYREDLEILQYEKIENLIEQIKILSNSYSSKITVSCSSKMTARIIKESMPSNIKCMVLDADTPEIDKEFIYEQFEKENHDYWDVFIYTPTLTVGVSILNESDHHFHIDESNTVDVISSLQMIRRSRKSKIIHLFLKKIKRFSVTDLSILDNEIKNNISLYYKQNKNSLLIDIDVNGDFKLSDTGKFANKVEILHNTLENDHKHSFELLIKHQVKGNMKLVKASKSTIDLSSIRRKIKENDQKNMLKILKELSNIDYSPEILDEYKHRNYLVNDKDKMIKIMAQTQNHLKNYDKDILKEITKIEIVSKFKFIKELKGLNLYLNKDLKAIKDIMSYIVSEKTNDRNTIMHYRYIVALKQKHIQLKPKFTPKESKEIDLLLNFGEFKSYLRKIGYKSVNGSMVLTKVHADYIKYIK